MNQERFEPIASILVSSYLDTRVYSHEFKDEYGIPPTVMANAHHLRAVVQARVTRTDGFLLGQRYAEFGRVEITDPATKECFLLQSLRALSIEADPGWGRLFPLAAVPSPVKMLVYDFASAGLSLALADAKQRDGSRRLYAASSPVVIGVWPYSAAETEPFDQGDIGDAFEDLGSVDMDEQADDA